MPVYCQIPNCQERFQVGWATGGPGIKKYLAVCWKHFRRHHDPKDKFNFWDIVGLIKPALEEIDTRKIYEIKAIKYISKGDLECLKRRLS